MDEDIAEYMKQIADTQEEMLILANRMMRNPKTKDTAHKLHRCVALLGNATSELSDLEG